MTWLVTGGAGYIGSHIVDAFRSSDRRVAVVDDLSTGHREFVPADVPFHLVDITDTGRLTQVMAEHAVTGVVHLAGYKFAGESVRQPLATYRANVQGTASVLAAMQATGVECIVFSSSAAVYGTPAVDRVTESTPAAPESPYGQTKLVGEWLMAAQAEATPLRHTSLRYFNVVGSGADHLFDTSPHNLFPLVFDALDRGEPPRIFGEDYPTPDGTCVRDYVHVADVAAAHVAAAGALEAGSTLRPVYNLGSGDGTSVRQIMDAVRSVTGKGPEPVVVGRRPGDPARIVADGSLAARDLSWAARHSLEDMVRSAWQAREGASRRR